MSNDTLLLMTVVHVTQCVIIHDVTSCNQWLIKHSAFISQYYNQTYILILGKVSEQVVNLYANHNLKVIDLNSNKFHIFYLIRNMRAINTNIFSHGFRATRMAALLAFLTHSRSAIFQHFSPRILDFNDKGRSLLRSKIHKITLMLAFRQAYVIFVFSKEVLEYFLKRNLPKDKIIQIPIGFLPDTAKRPQRKMSKTDEFKIVVVSRLNLEKNLIFALEVLSELRKIDGSISVSFYGNGPELSKLLNYRKVSKLEDIVDFKGFEDNLSSVYPSFDLLLHTSRTEGFCQVIVEALASGLKVFSSYVGVVQDLRSLDTPNLEVFDLTADAFTVASQLHNFICQPILKNPQLDTILNRFSFENMKLGIDSSIEIMRSEKIDEDL